MEIDKIYNMDCLEGMKHIPDGSIDAIICDLPYGTIKNLAFNSWAEGSNDWDVIIPTEPLFEQYKRVLRQNGVAILFSQEPYTHELRAGGDGDDFKFIYPLMWLKSAFAVPFQTDKAPVSYFEDMSVFRKVYDLEGNNPMRDYSLKVLKFIGKPKREIINEIGQCADHFFRHSSSQFAAPTPETYAALIERYHIDQMEGFLPYNKLGAPVFNLPAGKLSKSNVFQYAKDQDNIHPTQKPVALIADLIRTYSNEGDTILDNCMGSGTTAVACIKEKRHFIGFELNEQYFDKACQRIDAEQRQLTLF